MENNDTPKLEAILPGKEEAAQPQPDAALPPPTGQAFTTEEAVELLLALRVHPQMDCSGHDAAIANIEKATKDCIMAYLNNCPNNVDRLGAVRRVREALMLAKMAIITPQVLI